MTGYKRDPIEYDRRRAWMVEEAEKEASAELAASGIKPDLGYCHSLWPRMKQIMKAKYGVNWRSPAELNPDIFFD